MARKCYVLVVVDKALRRSQLQHTLGTCIDVHVNMFLGYVDYEKAFDIVTNNALFGILQI